jgi:hypothetical protein
LLRREAVLLLQEIFSRCHDETLFNFVFLRRVAKEGSDEDFELHIKADISDSARPIIESIAEKHQLLVTQSGKYVIVYSPGRSPIQITASFSDTAPPFSIGQTSVMCDDCGVSHHLPRKRVSNVCGNKSDIVDFAPA